jgi:carbon storage regulator
MLVLTRREDERIIIGNDIWITVVRVDGNKVKLGIDAPKNISVFREEIVEGAKNEAGRRV